MPVKPFPGASKTFSVNRETITYDGINPRPAGVTAVHTGISITLHDLNDVTAVGKDGTEALHGMYRGSTFPNADIRVGDILRDETENDVNGDPAEYEVKQATKYVPYLKLHLYRNQTPA